MSNRRAWANTERVVEDFVEHIPGIPEDTAEVADILKKITLRDMSNVTTWETNFEPAETQ